MVMSLVVVHPSGVAYEIVMVPGCNAYRSIYDAVPPPVPGDSTAEDDGETDQVPPGVGDHNKVV
jgi:hypothetical protein